MSTAASVDATVAIDDEFASLIPPLADEERRELEASLVECGGPRDPLVVWDQDGTLTLLDGHNRHAICKSLGLPFAITAIELPDREAAIRWIERNQLGRRNLSRESYAIIIGRLYNRAKARKGNWKRRPVRGEKTSDEFGKRYGVSSDTIERAGKYQEAAERLGVEADIAAGRMRVPIKHLARAARRRRSSNASPCKAGRPPKTWLVPSEPADCLKAIRFYAKTFAVQAPESMDALVHTLMELLDEHRRCA